MILIFFTLSFAGWVWEVSLHLITDGEFANRGVMHGPWLPIYGCGSVMILLLLNKFRRKPAVEFVLAMLLCGCVEYFTSLFLESLHGGTRWWDYTGYFLNLQGRICAEGLLTFGIGGMAIVYVLVPFLDGLFRKLPVRALIITACILSAAFAVAVLWFGELFELTALDFQAGLVIVVFLMLTPSVIFVFEKGLDMLELLAAACQQRLGGSGRRRSGRER